MITKFKCLFLSVDFVAIAIVAPYQDEAHPLEHRAFNRVLELALHYPLE